MLAYSSPVNGLPVEIFPIIASLLPLYATPPTLLSLALVNKHISTIALPLLYSCLILKCEEDALKMIRRLLNEPELGRIVREIHIQTNLSSTTRTAAIRFDVVGGLQEVLMGGLLPYIHTLDLELLVGWHYDERWERVSGGFGRLQPRFWAELRKNCPLLRSLALRSMSDKKDDLWIENAGLYEIQVSARHSVG